LNIPGDVTNTSEGGRSRPNGLEKKFRISPKKQVRSVNLAAEVLEGEQSLRASERPFRGVSF
jgi:hypothetical protein